MRTALIPSPDSSARHAIAAAHSLKEHPHNPHLKGPRIRPPEPTGQRPTPARNAPVWRSVQGPRPRHRGANMSYHQSTGRCRPSELAASWACRLGADPPPHPRRSSPPLHPAPEASLHSLRVPISAWRRVRCCGVSPAPPARRLSARVGAARELAPLTRRVCELGRLLALCHGVRAPHVVT